MGLLVTPRDFAQRAELYHQLGQLTAAGIGLIQALHIVERAPPTRKFRKPLQRLVAELEAGNTFSEALETTGDWVPVFDIALLRAGEKSGQLDKCFKLLAEYYLDRAQISRRVIAELAYPVFLLHFAVFTLAAPRFFRGGNLTSYIADTLGVLVPIYILVLVIVYASQAKHGEKWRTIIERIMLVIPAVGTTRRELALARLTAALEALINAGYPIYESWQLAAAASGSPVLKRVVAGWKPKFEAGQTPAELLQTCGQFPELFVNLYSSGEISGKLDETLRQLHKIFQEEGTRKLHLLAHWIPRLIYIFIVLWIAKQIVDSWSGYSGLIDSVVGF